MSLERDLGGIGRDYSVWKKWPGSLETDIFIVSGDLLKLECWMLRCSWVVCLEFPAVVLLRSYLILTWEQLITKCHSEGYPPRDVTFLYSILFYLLY